MNTNNELLAMRDERACQKQKPQDVMCYIWTSVRICPGPCHGTVPSVHDEGISSWLGDGNQLLCPGWGGRKVQGKLLVLLPWMGKGICWIWSCSASEMGFVLTPIAKPACIRLLSHHSQWALLPNCGGCSPLTVLLCSSCVPQGLEGPLELLKNATVQHLLKSWLGLCWCDCYK